MAEVNPQLPETDTDDVLENFDFDAFLESGNGHDFNMSDTTGGEPAQNLASLQAWGSKGTNSELGGVLAINATISQDVTGGKSAQELALLRALGSKYGVDLSLLKASKFETEGKIRRPFLLASDVTTVAPAKHSVPSLKRSADTEDSFTPSAIRPKLSVTKSKDKMPHSEKQPNATYDSSTRDRAHVEHDLSPAHTEGSILRQVSSPMAPPVGRAPVSNTVKNPFNQMLQPLSQKDLTDRHYQKSQNCDTSSQSGLENPTTSSQSPSEDSTRHDTNYTKSEATDTHYTEMELAQTFKSAEVSAQNSSHIRSLAHDSTDLQRKHMLLKQEYLRLKQKVEQLQLPTVSVLYRVYCDSREDSAITTDPPSSFGSSSHLVGSDPVPDLGIFIAERKSNLAFLIFKNYTCCSDSESEVNRTEDSVLIISTNFAQYMTELTENLKKSDGFFPKFAPDAEFNAPFLWYYQCLSEFAAEMTKFPKKARCYINCFRQYVEEDFGHLYKAVTSQLREGTISQKNLPFLYSPGSVLSCREYGAMGTGVLESWPDFEWPCRRKFSAFPIWCWKFDDEAFEDYDEDELIDIIDLPCFPLQYIDTSSEAALREEGETFWKCRKKCFVTYNGWDSRHEEWNTDMRYMVDLATYYKMHPENQPSTRLKDELGPDTMASNEAPKGDFVFLLPSKVRGFNLLEKKWVELDVSGISDIKWNKEAFDSLAIEEDTKLLITALVTNKIEADKSTDLIQGKGSGLMILLHGGPGTGKTLTAESVAEIAEKPLYRVTCGDIGTNPDSVEKYLNTVLLLGKTWDCVVLLDEADVFLEQRTLTDLQRNALVSVFLRVLEYYDGILILTSNRVGTFDEAFKSRIQLALHYEGLTQGQRRKIWGNFIRRLETLEDEEKPLEGHFTGRVVDTDDLRNHLPELSKFELNGREIRNAVTTARQLALYKKKRMDYKDIVHVIGVIGKFNKYLQSVNEGTTDEQIMREDHVR